MSGKENKKIRKAVRKQVNIDLKDVAISMQSLILKFGFRQRLKIALQILFKRPWLNGAFDSDKTKK